MNDWRFYVDRAMREGINYVPMRTSGSRREAEIVKKIQLIKKQKQEKEKKK